MQSQEQSSWEFLYVEHGKLCVSVENGTYILKSGEMICFAPVQHHTIKAYQGNATAISFQFEATGELAVLENKIFFLNYQQKHYLDEMMAADKKQKQLQDENDTACLKQILRNSVEILVLSLLSNRLSQQSKQGDLNYRRVQHKNITNDIIQYLNVTLAEPVKLQDIAERFSYSLSSIKRIFKNETGVSIIEYQNINRITQSKRLLESSDATIDEIAGSLGFSDSSYFSRIFKKQVGISPSAYRKSVKNRKNNI